MKTLTLEKVATLAGLDAAAAKAIAAKDPLAVRRPGALQAGSTRLTGVSDLEDATPESLVFAQDAASLATAIASKAGAILAPASLVSAGMASAGLAAVGLIFADPRVIAVDSPKYAFAVCARELSEGPDLGVHTLCWTDETARWGKRVCIDAGAVLEEGVVLGDDVVIGAGAKILKGTQIGDRVVVQAGAVLGSTGFGYVRNRETGEYLLFPQIGRVVIEDDVEIGANTTIDRGALGETRIGRGTKIDNLVQIGHNCRIGQNVIIAAQVGVSGSCVIEDGAILAGQVGLGDHVTIGKGVILGGQGGVYPGKTVEGEGEMFAGTPAEPVKEFLKTLARVRRLK